MKPMSKDRTTIPAWELAMLRAIVAGRYPAAREDALRLYLAERERRRRYARVRDAKDRERRTLVGAHMSKADAEFVRFIAEQEGVSMTAFVRFALKQAVERSDTWRGA